MTSLTLFLLLLVVILVVGNVGLWLAYGRARAGRIDARRRTECAQTWPACWVLILHGRPPPRVAMPGLGGVRTCYTGGEKAMMVAVP